MIFPHVAAIQPKLVLTQGHIMGPLPVIKFQKIIFTCTEAVTKMMLMIELFINHKEFANFAQQSK